MPYILSRDTVANYESFRAAVVRDAERRQFYGCTGVRLLRNDTVPDEVFALLKFETAEDARKFHSARDTEELDSWFPTFGSSDALILEEIEELPY